MQFVSRPVGPTEKKLLNIVGLTAGGLLGIATAAQMAHKVDFETMGLTATWTAHLGDISFYSFAIALLCIGLVAARLFSIPAAKGLHIGAHFFIVKILPILQKESLKTYRSIKRTYLSVARSRTAQSQKLPKLVD